MLKELRSREKVIGVKQSRRAIREGRARQVFLACDADPALTGPLLAQCREKTPESRWGPLWWSCLRTGERRLLPDAPREETRPVAAHRKSRLELNILFSEKVWSVWFFRDIFPISCKK